MNPPSWDTPNATMVRDELLRRVEREAAAPAPASGRAPARRPDRFRSVWVTAAVGFAILALVVVVLNAVHVRGRDVAPAGEGLTEEAIRLLEEVPQPPGPVVHTWTQDATTGTDEFRIGERTAVVGGACTGGGSITVTGPAGASHALDCAATAVLQPVWQTSAARRGAAVVADGPVTVQVRVTAGSPHYVVRLWAADPSALDSGFAVAPTSSAVPASLRDCTSRDLAQGASFTTPDEFQRGLVMITNTSSTDCAVRAWPTLRPLDAAGNRIGPSPAFGQARSLDGAEGDASSSAHFPPARLAAGAHGYFITDLDTLGDLQQQDRRARTDAQGEPGTAAYVAPEDRTVFCGAAPVAALRVTVGPAVLTVPLTDRSTGACQDVAQNLDVDPVVNTRPQG